MPLRGGSDSKPSRRLRRCRTSQNQLLPAAAAGRVVHIFHRQTASALLDVRRRKMRHWRHGIGPQIRRLRALPCPQRLLAARGRARHRDARQARQGRRPACARDHRHELAVRRAGVLGKAREIRRAAADRRADHLRFRRRAEGGVLAARRGTVPPGATRAHRAERAGLHQPHAARLRRLAEAPGRRRAACLVRRDRRLRGPGRADRRPARTDRPGAAFPTLGDVARNRLRRLVGRFGDRLYVELQRHDADGERRNRGRADRARL